MEPENMVNIRLPKETEDVIEINSLEEYLNDHLAKYVSKTSKQVFELINIRALVIYQLTENISDIDFVESLKSSEKNPYHFYINDMGKIYQINPITRALQHCRSVQYTEKANEYFGDEICPLFKDTPETPHPEASPDNCTVSILIARGSPDQPNIFDRIRFALIRLCAYIINKYSPALQGPANILSANYISDTLTNSTLFDFKTAKDFNDFRYDVEKLRSKWFIEYANRGYCGEIINTIDVANTNNDT